MTQDALTPDEFASLVGGRLVGVRTDDDPEGVDTMKRIELQRMIKAAQGQRTIALAQRAEAQAEADAQTAEADRLHHVISAINGQIVALGAVLETYEDKDAERPE